MRNIQISVVLAVAFLFGACGGSEDNSYLVPNISGKVNEVIVVVNKSTWDGQVGDSLFSVLTKELPGLPQAEPYFDVSDVSPASFNSLQSLRTFRNLVIVQIDAKHKKPDIVVKKGKWAKQQLVMTLKAPNKAAFIELLSEKGEIIRDIVRTAEAKRIARNYNKFANIDVINHLKDKYGFTLTVPKNYKIEQRYNNFVWLAHETPEISQGILLYWYPYTAENQLSKDSLISRRNYFVQKYVPGPIEGSYMTTDTKAPISYEMTETRKTFATILRGLWYTENDFMGGPFMSVSKIDEKQGMVVTAEGFVYAPKFPKRNYIQQLEEIVRTLRFPQKEDSE